MSFAKLNCYNITNRVLPPGFADIIVGGVRVAGYEPGAAFGELALLYR